MSISGIDIEFDLSDMKESSIRRKFTEVLSQLSRRSLPKHRRGDGEDDATEDADDEHDKLVDLHAKKGEPAAIPATEEDFPEGLTDGLPKAKKKKKKKNLEA